MPRRPLPIFPRGRRRQIRRDVGRLLACPKLDPTWELRALGTLMKPKADAALPTAPDQAWSSGDALAAGEVIAAASAALGVEVQTATEAAGDFHLTCRLHRCPAAKARGIALALSRRLPEHWFRLDHLLVHAGTFHRRREHYKLELVKAGEATVPRPIRAALQGLL